MYPVTAAPLAAAGDHDTVAEPERAVARTSTGAVGTATGTTAGEGAEAADVPTRFVAVATNV
jgi:hypothetical protein